MSSSPRIAMTAVALIAAAVTASAVAAGSAPTTLDKQLAYTLIATREYVNDISLARHEGYRAVAPAVPGIGLRLVNPAIKGFDAARPPVLIYERQGNRWQLGAVEWHFTTKPSTATFQGARYLRAASGLALRVWLWQANPKGLYARTNPAATYSSPLVAAYDAG